jgi:hypothetical protein
MEIRADFSALNDLQRLAARFPAIVADELDRAMHAAVLVGEAEIVQRTPVDTGRLRSSISSGVQRTPEGPEGIVFVQQVAYAVPVEEGTRPHVIVPRTKRVLRFTSGNRVVFARQVNHPGTKGRHMFREGAAAAEPEIRRIFERALQRAIVRVGRGR